MAKKALPTSLPPIGKTSPQGQLKPVAAIVPVRAGKAAKPVNRKPGMGRGRA